MRSRLAQLFAVAVTVAIAAGACGKRGASAGDGAAGEVERVIGAVTATRAAAGAEPRTLTASDPVFADDTIDTGDGAAVDIRLAHNGALWQLGANASRRVDASAAWRAERSGAGAFGQTDDDRTAAAGRHAERDTMPRRAEETGEVGMVEPEDEGDGFDAEQDSDEKSRRTSKKDGPKDGRFGLGGGIGAGTGTGAGGRGGGGPGGTESGAPSVKLGSLEVDGELDASAVRRVMRGRLAAIKRCYEHELGKDESFVADVEVLFTVAPGGRLSPVTVSDVPNGNDTFEHCLKAAVRAVRMPTADAETRVRLRLIFSR